MDPLSPFETSNYLLVNNKEPKQDKNLETPKQEGNNDYSFLFIGGFIGVVVFYFLKK